MNLKIVHCIKCMNYMASSMYWKHRQAATFLLSFKWNEFKNIFYLKIRRSPLFTIISSNSFVLFGANFVRLKNGTVHGCNCSILLALSFPLLFIFLLHSAILYSVTLSNLAKNQNNSRSQLDIVEFC